ncbi:MAG: ribbon-helix-helix protein, CopG family [Candidatus Aminicenantes bacterium]|nr:ribbon-helix-helix protein, CopG family [Candidatus Aminicenantes bacterium]
MEKQIKKYTVYLDSDLHRALRVKAAQTEYSVSELVNEAIENALKEDALDLEAFEKRKKEPLLVFEDVLKKLKKDGKI